LNYQRNSGWQHSQRKPDQIENSQADKGSARVQYIIFTDQDKRSERHSGYEEGRTRPGKARYNAIVGIVAVVLDLVLSHLADQVLKGQFPAVEFNHLDPVQDLVEHLQAQVLAL